MGKEIGMYENAAAALVEQLGRGVDRLPASWAPVERAYRSIVNAPAPPDRVAEQQQLLDEACLSAAREGRYPFGVDISGLIAAEAERRAWQEQARRMRDEVSRRVMTEIAENRDQYIRCVQAAHRKVIAVLYETVNAMDPLLSDDAAQQAGGKPRQLLERSDDLAREAERLRELVHTIDGRHSPAMWLARDRDGWVDNTPVVHPGKIPQTQFSRAGQPSWWRTAIRAGLPQEAVWAPTAAEQDLRAAELTAEHTLQLTPEQLHQQVANLPRSRPR